MLSTPSLCSPHSPRRLTIGEAIFDNDYLLELAKSSGFHKRSPRKIDACSLLASICAESVKGSPSCNDLAVSIEACHPEAGPSRQAVCLRLGQPFETFVHRLLEDVIAGKNPCKQIGGPVSPEGVQSFAGYRRVLVADSTIIKLPAHLFAEFSGVSNAFSKVCNARIQASYDLLAGQLVDFSIDSYSKNDLTAASELHIEAGDLVLRDRGYLTADEIQRHRDAGADCIYRHKTGTIYLDPETLKPIDLPAILRSNGQLDIMLRLNNSTHTPVRLLAAPVDEETANLRRMKARKETHGHNPSKAVLELMGWTILITTIDSAQYDFGRLLAIYGLRWRIEVIFKAWKSHMNFHILHRVSKIQMIILLKARLLLITCCTNILFRRLENSIWQRYKRRISLLKLMKFLSAAPANILRALRNLSAHGSKAQGFDQALLRYCCYDKRLRRNYSETWEALA